jgi:2-dehydropantoate 2-reductase
MSRIAVVGADAIGCVFGGHLASLGRHEVTFRVREAFGEISVESPGGAFASPARCATDPAGAAPADWVLLAVKAHQVAGAAAWLGALCGEGTVLAVLQNGAETRGK